VPRNTLTWLWPNKSAVTNQIRERLNRPIRFNLRCSINFTWLRHNDIRDLTAELMSEVCHDVSKKRYLQPLSGELLSLCTCNQNDGAWLNIRASGFWSGQFQSFFFFDVCIFNPYAPSNQSNPYRKHEGTKCRAYKEQVREIEHASLSPLVFSNSWGMGASTTVTYKHLAFLLSSSGRLHTVR